MSITGTHPLEQQPIHTVADEAQSAHPSDALDVVQQQTAALLLHVHNSNVPTETNTVTQLLY